MRAGDDAATAPHVLLLSNSQNHGRPVLEHAQDWIRSLVAGAERIAIVPFARLPSSDAHAASAQVFHRMGLHVEVTQRHPSAVDTLTRADAVFVLGGNTFRLLRDLYRYDILDALRTFGSAGRPYIGASAGCNVACPSIATTNDMPVVEPPSFAALGLVPFQVNTHYVEHDGPPGHMGETRLQRLQEYAAETHRAVIGLPEGRALRPSPHGYDLLGGGATIVRADGSAYQIPGGPLCDAALRDLLAGTGAPG